jgi:hypothetical protein
VNGSIFSWDNNKGTLLGEVKTLQKLNIQVVACGGRTSLSVAVAPSAAYFAVPVLQIRIWVPLRRCRRAPARTTYAVHPRSTPVSLSWLELICE